MATSRPPLPQQPHLQNMSYYAPASDYGRSSSGASLLKSSTGNTIAVPSTDPTARVSVPVHLQRRSGRRATVEILSTDQPRQPPLNGRGGPVVAPAASPQMSRKLGDFTTGSGTTQPSSAAEDFHEQQLHQLRSELSRTKAERDEYRGIITSMQRYVEELEAHAALHRKQDTNSDAMNANAWRQQYDAMRVKCNVLGKKLVAAVRAAQQNESAFVLNLEEQHHRDRQEIRRAVEAIEAALDDDLWLDQVDVGLSKDHPILHRSSGGGDDEGASLLVDCFRVVCKVHAAMAQRKLDAAKMSKRCNSTRVALVPLQQRVSDAARILFNALRPNPTTKEGSNSAHHLQTEHSDAPVNASRRPHQSHGGAHKVVDIRNFKLVTEQHSLSPSPRRASFTPHEDASQRSSADDKAFEELRQRFGLRSEGSSSSTQFDVHHVRQPSTSSLHPASPATRPSSVQQLPDERYATSVSVERELQSALDILRDVYHEFDRLGSLLHVVPPLQQAPEDLLNGDDNDELSQHLNAIQADLRRMTRVSLRQMKALADRLNDRHDSTLCAATTPSLSASTSVHCHRSNEKGGETTYGHMSDGGRPRIASEDYSSRNASLEQEHQQLDIEEVGDMRPSSASSALQAPAPSPPRTQQQAYEAHVGGDVWGGDSIPVASHNTSVASERRKIVVSPAF